MNYAILQLQRSFPTSAVVTLLGDGACDAALIAVPQFVTSIQYIEPKYNAEPVYQSQCRVNCSMSSKLCYHDCDTSPTSSMGTPLFHTTNDSQSVCVIAMHLTGIDEKRYARDYGGSKNYIVKRFLPETANMAVLVMPIVAHLKSLLAQQSQELPPETNAADANVNPNTHLDSTMVYAGMAIIAVAWIAMIGLMIRKQYLKHTATRNILSPSS